MNIIWTGHEETNMSRNAYIGIGSANNSLHSGWVLGNLKAANLVSNDTLVTKQVDERTTMQSKIENVNTLTANNYLQGTFNVTEYDHDAPSSYSGNNEHDYSSDYPLYPYPAFSFEIPIYLYIWEILVIVVFLVNIIVISVFLRKGMRNPTNLILVAIATSDSLTGLITLPSYIAVYLKYESSPYEQESSDDGCILDKQLCRFFMISKFSIFQIFHTISIYLTVFLGCQRYISVAYPFKSQTMFTMRNTALVCVCVFIFSPILHIYQIMDEKAVAGVCQWYLSDCKLQCAYIWIIFFARHLIPCVVLVSVTLLFIGELRKGETNMRRTGSNLSQISRRTVENRRISLLVLIIVVVFLIPEIPYGIFLLINIVAENVLLRVEESRAIEAAYELLLVLSFHANFYIYAFFNRRFRKGLKITLTYPINLILGKPRRWSISSYSTKSDTHKTKETTPGENETKLKLMIPHTSNTYVVSKFDTMNTCSELVTETTQ